MNKLKLFLMFMLGVILPTSGQEKDVLAILTLEAKGIENKDVIALRNEIGRQFSRDTGLIVLDDEIIQEMLKEQGFDRSAPCSNIQCYTGIGHLLTASKVVGGTITLDNNGVVSLSLGIVDVDKSEMIYERTVSSATMSRILTSEIPKLASDVLEKYHNWKSGGSGQPVTIVDKPIMEKKKRHLLRSMGWLTSGALIAGGGAVVYFKYFRPSSSPPGAEPGPDQVISDIPIDDAPVHDK